MLLTTDMTNDAGINESIQALGINISSKNYINERWKHHCKEIEGLDFMSTDFEDSYDESDDNNPSTTPLSHDNPITRILSLINSPEEAIAEKSLSALYKQLDDQLMVLRRFKSDLELALRFATKIEGDN